MSDDPREEVLRDSAAARAEQRIRDGVNFGLTRPHQPYTVEEAHNKIQEFYKTYPYFGVPRSMVKQPERTKTSVQDLPKCPNCGALIYDGLRCSGCGQRS